LIATIVRENAETARLPIITGFLPTTSIRFDRMGLMTIARALDIAIRLLCIVACATKSPL
jgi:hypothetical protein